MAESLEARNKVLVLAAFDALFNRGDYAAAVKLLAGREGLIELIKRLPPTLNYERDSRVAHSDFTPGSGT